MSSIKKLVPILLLTLIISPNALSERRPEDLIIGSIFMSLSEEHDRDWLVNHVKEYCQAVFTTVPRNSPEEQTWLSNELNSGDINRYRVAITSIQAIRNILINEAENCIKLTTDYKSVLIHPNEYYFDQTEILIELGRTLYSSAYREAINDNMIHRINSDLVDFRLYKFVKKTSGDLILRAATQASIERRN